MPLIFQCPPPILPVPLIEDNGVIRSWPGWPLAVCSSSEDSGVLPNCCTSVFMSILKMEKLMLEMPLSPPKVCCYCDSAQGIICRTHLVPSSWKAPVHMVALGFAEVLPPVPLRHPAPLWSHCPSQLSISLVHESFGSLCMPGSLLRHPWRMSNFASF